MGKKQAKYVRPVSAAVPAAVLYAINTLQTREGITESEAVRAALEYWARREVPEAFIPRAARMEISRTRGPFGVCPYPVDIAGRSSKKEDPRPL